MRLMRIAPPCLSLKARMRAEQSHIQQQRYKMIDTYSSSHKMQHSPVYGQNSVPDATYAYILEHMSGLVYCCDMTIMIW